MDIKRLKIYKLPGTDQIPAEMVQAAGRTVYSKILSLILFGINKLMSQQWKESIFVPIYRMGDKTDCSNYRSISQLSTTYKILSNISLPQLTPYADAIIGYSNCILWHNRATNDHIFWICHITEKIGNTNRQYVSHLQTSRKLMFQLGKRFGIIFSLSLVHPSNHWDNKISKVDRQKSVW